MKYLLCTDYERLCYKNMERGGREADSKNVRAVRVWKWKVLIHRDSRILEPTWNHCHTHFLILLATHMWSVSYCNYFITKGFLPMKMKYIVAHTMCLLLQPRPRRRVRKKYNWKFRTVSHYLNLSRNNNTSKGEQISNSRFVAGEEAEMHVTFFCTKQQILSESISRSIATENLTQLS